MTLVDDETVTILADPGNGIRRVVSRRDTLGGEPIFEGTRITVHHVGEQALQGAPIEDLLADFPRLTRADIDFARRYAEDRPRENRPAGRLRFVREA